MLMVQKARKKKRKKKKEGNNQGWINSIFTKVFQKDWRKQK